MKRWVTLSVVLISPVMLLGEEGVVYLDTVKLVNAWVNKNKVRIVEVIGTKATYQLSCNVESVGCDTPRPGEQLDLVALNRDKGMYECENVGLSIPRTTDKYRGIYCLTGTTPRNH